MMATPEWPLRDAIPSTTADSSTAAAREQTSSDGMHSLHMLDRLDSPQWTLHGFHKSQQSPVLATSPVFDSRRIRRKPSLVNLSTAHARHAGPAAHALDEPWTPSLILPRSHHPTSLYNSSPSSSLGRPLTPRPQTYTAPPSLSSSIDTFQSSPFHTPLRLDRLHIDSLDQEQVLSSAEPLRTKRKFESWKRAKRLPRHTSGGGGESGPQGELWEVYAAVFDLEEDIGVAVHQGDLKKANSVKFETREEEHGETLGGEDSQTAREGSPTSSTSVSRPDWPLPAPNDDERHTSDHSDNTTPSPPATVSYRGASFDVLNPHASLILGSRSLETPAEIDGLLDSYFHSHDRNMQADTEFEESAPRVSGDNFRRVLYDNATDARRNILHIDQCEQGPIAPPAKALLPGHPGRKVERPFSDPFDLTLSDSDSHSTLMTINHVLKEGRRNDTTSPTTRMQPLGLGITDFDEPHATSEHTTDPTIKAILAGYEYTRAQSSQLEDMAEQADTNTSQSIEHGRRGDHAPSSSHLRSQGLLSPLQTPEAIRIVPLQMTYGRAPALTPPQPVFTGSSSYGPAGQHYTNGSDLPTTDQSYGHTSTLLNITPPDVRYQTKASRPICHPATCTDPAHVHFSRNFTVYADDSPEFPEDHRVQEYEHDDKENIPPDDHEPPQVAAQGMHGDFDFRFGDEGFRFPDCNDEDNDSDAGDLGRRTMMRSSSVYPEDELSEWVTEYGVSQLDLNRNSRLSDMSDGSYANTSHMGSQSRFSLPSPPPQTPLPDLPGENPPRKAISILGEAPKTILTADDAEERRRCLVAARIRILESKIAEEQANKEYAGSPKIDVMQRRADLAELETLRRLLPSESRPLGLRASASMTNIKASAQATLQKAKTFVRPQYQPKINFSRGTALGRHEVAFNSGSDTRGLLASPETLSPYTNMGFNDSTGTFMTVHPDSPVQARGPATKLWSPFDQDPTHRAIHIKSPIVKRANVVDVELRPIDKTKSKRSHRAAIGSQYEPRDLQLIKTKRMSDAQLLASSAGWTMAPRKTVGDTAPAVTAGNNPWSSSSTYPMLLKPETELERDTRLEQKRISKRYVYGCAAFPPLTLLFGLGFFDRFIAQRSGGQIPGACAKEKRNALIVFFPLAMIFWAVCILAILLIVTLVQGKGGQDSSPFA